MTDKLLVICGPTASGKTELAVNCAELLNSEVISADSMNVYKRLDVGTAKPTKDEMRGIKHHMIDVVEPSQSFSVGDYRELAEPIVLSLLKKGKIPVICGGTGFYINSLLFDFSYGNSAANLEIREKYKEFAEKEGNAYVYEKLKSVDPAAAEKIHCNDLKRVIRALEIYESGVKKSDIKNGTVAKYRYNAYSFDLPRETLYKKIDVRVDGMINSGLVEEVDALKNEGITYDMQCMQGIGYKEIYEYLDGKQTLDGAIDKIKLNTRHYAKRQITFFKKLAGLVYMNNEDKRAVAERIVNEL